MMRRIRYVVLIVAGILTMSVWSSGDEGGSQSAQQTTYVLRSSVIGVAGAPTATSGFRQKGTLAQPTPIGIATESDTTLYAGFWHVWTTTVTGIEEKTPVFVDQLFQNYPNPFNPTTTIQYAVANPSPVEITIYNVRGERVRQLASELKPPGLHTVTWDATNDRGQAVASGVYFYRLQVGAFSDVKKMVILK